MSRNNLAEVNPPAAVPFVAPLVAPADLDHRYIPIASIEVSKTNPRKHFDQQKLDELRESILRHGVLQPILVRPMFTVRVNQAMVGGRWYAEVRNNANRWNPQGVGWEKREEAEADAARIRNSRFELIAGERRFRATRDGGLDTIPAVVMDLDDKQVLEVQVIENLQRADLHPLEEAEGYAELIRKHGYDADSLALKIGKSRSYVYGRMKLADCCDVAKKALWDGKLSHSVALLIARIPDVKVQREATKELLRQSDDGELSFRRAADVIDREFLLRLGKAKWALDDATLVPAAGPCTTCPFRSGNQTDIVDTKSADVCTNPKCYREKQDALWARCQAEASRRGDRILPKSELPKVFSASQWGGTRVLHDAPYVSLDEDAADIGQYNTTYRKLLGKFVPPLTVARHPRTGAIFELVARKDLQASLKAAGIKKPSYAGGGGRDSYQAQQRAEAAKRKVERAVEDAITAAVTPKLEALPLNEETLRIFTLAIAVERYYKIESWLKRRGHVNVTWEKREKLITEIVGGLSVGQMLGLIAESLVSFNPTEMRRETDSATQRRLCDLAGVDWQAIEKEIRAEAAAKQRAADERAKKKAEKEAAAARAAVKAAKAAAAAPARRKGEAAQSPKRAAGDVRPAESRDLQARYLVLVREFPERERAAFAKIAKTKGREAAISAMLEARSGAAGAAPDGKKAAPSKKSKAQAPAEASSAGAPSEHRIVVREGETAPYVVQGRASADDEWADVGRRFGSIDAAVEAFPAAWQPIDAVAAAEVSR